MKILHSGDIHLGELSGPIINNINARLVDTLNCMEFLAQTAREQEVDLIIIAGDLFHKSRLWADEMLWEVQKALNWLNQLAGIAPVVLLYGTPNHDNLEAFNIINDFGHPNVHVFTKADVRNVQTKNGMIQVAGLPGFEKGNYGSRKSGLSPDEENKELSQELSNRINELGSSINMDMPSILVSHFTVVGCEYENGNHVFFENEVLLRPQTIELSPFDLVALGHIHKAQKIGKCSKPTYYCGSLNAITFNDEDQDKGFWIHEIGKNDSLFIRTPYREFYTVRINQDDIEIVSLEGESYDYLYDVDKIKGKIVRVHYECSNEINRMFDKKKLEKALYNDGAFHVAEILPKVMHLPVNVQDINENSSIERNLIKYLERDISVEEIKEYLKTAAPIIADVEAGISAGKMTGVFTPVSIEVKNYRSFYEESFDFSKVTFAMVNGENGVGKSALFMDAITDCLYEETREDDINGWINNDPDIKSGMISFTFKMGATKWKVTRTRTRAKNSKTSLSLEEYVNSEWVDRSAKKTSDTEDKISELLGMDCNTFQSCVLIMQDKYGKFIEAKKEERMNILANLIGLKHYETMEKQAKELLTETKRDVKTIKESIDFLEVTVSKRPQLEAEKLRLNTEEANLKKEKEKRIEDYNKLNFEVAGLMEKKKGLDKGTKELAEKQEQLSKKNKLLADLKIKIEKASALLKDEDDIRNKADEYDKLKTKIAITNEKKSELEKQKTEKQKLDDDKKQKEKDLKKVLKQIDEIVKLFENEEEIQDKAKEYEKCCCELEEVDSKSKIYSVFNQKVQLLNTELDKIKIQESSEIEGMEKEISNLEKKTQLLNSSNCIDPQNAKCNFLKDAIEARDSVEGKKQELELIRDKWKKDIETKVNQIRIEAQKKDELRYDEEKHNSLINSNKELKEYHKKAEKLEGNKSTLEVHNQMKTGIETRIDELKKSISEKEKTIHTLMEELESLSRDERKLAELEEYHNKKELLHSAKNDEKNHMEQAKGIEDEIEGISCKLQSIKTSIDELSESLSGMDDKKAKADKLKIEIDDIQADEKKINESIGAIKTNLKNIDESNEKLDDERKNEKVKEKEITRLIKLAEAFSDNGIPFQIIKGLIPDIERISNEILAQMTGGRMSLEMKTNEKQRGNQKEYNTLDISINDEHGTLPYLSKSGGQKVKAALAVAFALANIKASRAGIQLGMLFIDEPPFIDAEGTDAYCNALEAIHMRYPYLRVLAISHDVTMKSRFPHQITVVSTDDGSKVLYDGV